MNKRSWGKGRENRKEDETKWEKKEKDAEEEVTSTKVIKEHWAKRMESVRQNSKLKRMGEHTHTHTPAPYSIIDLTMKG